MRAQNGDQTGEDVIHGRRPMSLSEKWSKEQASSREVGSKLAPPFNTDSLNEQWWKLHKFWR